MVIVKMIGHFETDRMEDPHLAGHVDVDLKAYESEKGELADPDHDGRATYRYDVFAVDIPESMKNKLRKWVGHTAYWDLQYWKIVEIGRSGDIGTVWIERIEDAGNDPAAP